MSNYKHKKAKCKHNKISNIKDKRYTFCENCGGIIMKNDLTLNYTIKPLSMEKQINEDPIKIYETMVKRSPILIDSTTIQNSYLKIRKIVMTYLQKLSMKMKYSDSTFYRALYYLDNTMKTIVDINSKQILYFTIAFFIISGKYNENDIFEPDLNDFIQFHEKYILQIDEMIKYEIICLKLIDYNLINYSSYDWLMVLLSNGFIFEEEISNKPSNIINNIYNYIKKCLALITAKPFFFQYNPFKIAFSLIQIGREKYIGDDDGKYFKFIKDLYKVKFSDYENCYKEIKNEIFNSNNKKISSNTQIDKKVGFKSESSSNQLSKIDNSELILDKTNDEIEEKRKIERQNIKTKTVKIENKIDLNINNNIKTKNDFVNDIEKISSKGTFSEKHPIIRRQNKLTGTVLIKEEEINNIKDTIKNKVNENNENEKESITQNIKK